MVNVQPLADGDPRRVGDYDVTGRLGEGGQGVVYLGRGHTGAVAIKLLHAQLIEDSQARARFVREVEVTKRVARFCTAQVLSAGLSGGRPYIVSEYVPGPSLHQQLRADGPRRGSALDRLAINTATALAAIHGAGVVHRDFKPGNVLMGPDGPVVIDFGISRALDASGTMTSAVSQVVGTPAFMAPEQLADGMIGPHTDMFAWAVTMVYAATGVPAFGHRSIPQVINRILHEQPNLGALEDHLRPIVAACLSKDPASRPAARDLIDALMSHNAEALGRPGAEPRGDGGRGAGPGSLAEAGGLGAAAAAAGSVAGSGAGGQGSTGSATGASGGPGLSGQGLSGPGVSGQGLSGPGVNGPGVSGQGLSGPDLSGPGVTGPGTGGSASGFAEGTDSGTARGDAGSRSPASAAEPYATTQHRPTVQGRPATGEHETMAHRQSAGSGGPVTGEPGSMAHRQSGGPGGPATGEPGSMTHPVTAPWRDARASQDSSQNAEARTTHLPPRNQTTVLPPAGGTPTHGPSDDFFSHPHERPERRRGRTFIIAGAAAAAAIALIATIGALASSNDPGTNHQAAASPTPAKHLRHPARHRSPSATRSPTRQAVAAATKSVKKNPYTPQHLCGAGYGVVGTHPVGEARTYLLYNNKTGVNCVVTMLPRSTGKVSLSASLAVQGGPHKTRAVASPFYAGPVRLPARGKCVIWGGTAKTAKWISGWSHCGK